MRSRWRHGELPPAPTTSGARLRRRPEAEGAAHVSGRLRLSLLVLTLLWLVALTPASVFAARAKAHRAHRASKALRSRRAIAARQLTRSSVFGERVVRYARELVGVPYVFRGPFAALRSR